MEVFKVQSENLAYEWNDVALLMDQRACTFLCKTMLQIPEGEVSQLQEIEFADWSRIPSQNDTEQFSGTMQLQIGYLNQQGERHQLQVEIPLQGTLQEPLREQADARLLYSKGQLADNYLLLETVLQIPRELQLQRTQVIVGQFEMAELLELPEQWPGCVDVLTTAAAAVVQDYAVHQQQVQVQGVYQLTAVYVNEEREGEQLFAYQQRRSMEVSVPVPAGLREITGVQPYYQSLSVQQLDDHHIQLTGSGVLCTLPVEEAKAAEPEMLAEPAEQETAGCEELCYVPQNRRQPQGPSVVNSRGSRRANLSKYMRDLNSSVQSPTSIRNFEIGLEPDVETTEEEL